MIRQNSPIKFEFAVFYSNAEKIYNFFFNNGRKTVDKMRENIYNNSAFGVMAQLVERLVRNEEASGSNPLSSTTQE